MRTFLIVFLPAFILLSAYWLWSTHPSVRNKTLDVLKPQSYQTLEVRYSAESIMETHKKELLKDAKHSFLEPSLLFHPYLLMEVKYSRSQEKTGEGIILWSLVDGEMVIDSNSWEETHGFTDCIRAGADKEDFKIINALASTGGFMDREALQKHLNLEDEILDNWLDATRKKNLIVQSGNNFRLHLQNPKLQVAPETKLNQFLVTKKFNNASRIPQKYRTGQIEYTARAAFGNDFTIRKTTQIFVPIFSITVQNPDGSQMTTYWNALNGKRLSQTLHIE